IEVLDGEDAALARREHGFLLLEILDGYREDWTVGRRLVAEALDVGFAERALPREMLLVYEPRSAAMAFAFGDLGKLRDDRLDILDGRHDVRVERRSQPRRATTR